MMQEKRTWISSDVRIKTMRNGRYREKREVK